MPDNGNLQHDIALLERAIEYGVETLTSGLLSTAECQVICEEMARACHQLSQTTLATS
jgi:hypothetical protein